MVKQFKKKPVVIEAIQYTGKNTKEIAEWSNNRILPSYFAPKLLVVEPFKEPAIFVKKNYWIVKRKKGDFYAYTLELFEQLYEEVLDPTYENSQENTNDLLGD